MNLKGGSWKFCERGIEVNRSLNRAKCVYDEIAGSMAFAKRMKTSSQPELKKIELLERHLPEAPLEGDFVLNEAATQKFRLMMTQVREELSDKGVI